MVGIAGTAQAHATRIEIADTAVIGQNFVQVAPILVTGTITCTAGARFTVRVNVQQKDPQTGEETYRARGSTKGTCTGSSQSWEVETSRDTGHAEPGPAHATAKGITQDGDSLKDTGDAAGAPVAGASDPVSVLRALCVSPRPG